MNLKRNLIYLIKFSSAILIDNNEIDNFINMKLLGHYGITDIIAFTNNKSALNYLKETENTYQLILVGLYMSIAGEFEFIDEFRKLELQNKHGKVLLLSAFFKISECAFIIGKGNNISYTIMT